MPERFPANDWPRPECGAWNAVFWISIGLITGILVGLIAWAIWGGR